MMNSDSDSQKNIQPAMPELPDGIGLTLDDVRVLLAQKNSITVSPDDPVLMIVTILNAFLTEEEKLLERHRKALTSILSDKTDVYIKTVEKTTSNLQESISSASVEEIKKIFITNNSVLQKFKINMCWLAAIVCITALINVALFVWL